MFFAVRLERGGPWDWSRDLREQDGWNEHARFMDSLVDDGFVVLGGPTRSDTRPSISSYYLGPRHSGIPLNIDPNNPLPNGRRNPDVLAEEQRPTEARTTSFPPTPDVLIIGRRHHVKDPEAVVRSYREAAGEGSRIGSIAGFELYVREKK